MPARKKRTRREPSGQVIDVARVVSVGPDRDTQEAILRLRDTNGRLIAIRLKPRQLGTLAKGVLGLAKARGHGEDE